MIVSASGALAPGPLTAVSIAVGARKGWKSGFGLALGHTLAEVPIVLAIFYGLSSFLGSESLRIWLGVIGCFSMVFFAVLTVKDAIKGISVNGKENLKGGAFATGFALTMFNPLFIIWWLSVGSPLIAEAIPQGLTELTVMYFAHVWIDYAWLIVVAYAGSVSKLNPMVYRTVLLLLGTLLLYFGLSLLITAVKI
ncbi:MAG: LysE family transporter [Thermofilaceae archaeon]